MAISNYQELKDEVIGWSKRSDQDLNIDNFIILAESEMYNHPRKSLRLRDTEIRATASMSITSRFLALPTGFNKMRSMRINVTDDYNVLTFTTPEGMSRRDDTGQPLYFTVSNQIEFDILPDEAYEVEQNYYGTAVGISSANTTNDVLTNHPDIYLFGCLYKLFTRVVDTEQAAVFQAMFYSAIQGANKTSRDGRFGVLPTMRVDGPTP